MKILLDTCVVLWWMSDPNALAQNERRIITDPEHIIYVSIASLWEIEIKRSIGKLKVCEDFHDQLIENDMTILPITVMHIQQLRSLLFHHKDPFDRVLIAQALSEDLRVITHDQNFLQYGVNFATDNIIANQ